MIVPLSFSHPLSKCKSFVYVSFHFHSLLQLLFSLFCQDCCFGCCCCCRATRPRPRLSQDAIALIFWAYSLDLNSAHGARPRREHFLATRQSQIREKAPTESWARKICAEMAAQKPVAPNWIDWVDAVCVSNVTRRRRRRQHRSPLKDLALTLSWSFVRSSFSTLF